MIFRKSLLAAIARFSSKRYKLLILASFILSISSALTLTNLSIDSDVLNLLPENNEFTRTFKETYEEFGSFDQLILAVTIPENENWTKYSDFIEELSGRLIEKPTITNVEYKIPELYSFFESMLQKGILFLNPREFELFKEKISDESIKKQMKKNRIFLVTSPSTRVKKKIEIDPLDLFSIFSQRFKEKERYIKIDVSKGYLLSRDHRVFALLIKPEKNPQNIKFDRIFASQLEEGIKQALHSIPVDLEKPGITYYGGHIIALEESQAIKSDLIKNIFTSALGIIILFFLIFRNIFTLILIFYPLVVSILITFGIMNLLGLELSASASGFTAILIGLGIDFAIVMYNRYLFERKGGKNNIKACEIMLMTVGWSILIGALTTSFSFFTLLITKFKGLSQLGLLTGMGILITLCTTYFLLPALLTANDRFFKKSKPVNMYLEYISTLSMRFPRSTLIAGGIVTLLLAICLFNVTFDEDFLKLRSGRVNLEEARKSIQEKFMSASNHMTIIIEGDEEILDINQRLYEKLLDLQASGKIGGVDSIQVYLNPTARQKEIMQKLKQNRNDLFDFERIERTFNSALEENKFRLEPFTPFLITLKKSITPENLISLDDLDAAGSGSLFSKYIRKKDSVYKVATYVYPNPDEWVSSAPQWFIDDVKGVDPRVKITGINLASQATKQIIKSDALRASFIAFIVVLSLLWFNFRKARSVMLTLIPLCVGLVWMFGASGLFSQPVNLINVFSVAMILGIGVDYGLHMFHRYEESDEFQKEHITTQGKGVTIAALTTIIGFSSLSFSSNPGVASLGIFATYGIVSTWLIAMTIIPAIFVLMSRNH